MEVVEVNDEVPRLLEAPVRVTVREGGWVDRWMDGWMDG